MKLIDSTLIVVLNLLTGLSIVSAQSVDDYCVKFVELVHSERYIEAKSLRLKNDMFNCGIAEYKRAMAILLSTELKYTEAILILRDLVKADGGDLESQMLLHKYSEILPITHHYEPLSVIPYRNVNTSNHDVIAWVGKAGIAVLTDSLSQIHYLPIKSEPRQQMKFSRGIPASQAQIVSEISKKLYKMGVDEPGPACFLADSSILMTVRKHVPYGKSGDWGNYEIVHLDSNIQRIHSVLHKEKGISYAFPAYRISDSILVFSSNRPGGLGEMDLWVTRGQNNSWETPVNAGPKINSEWNEIFSTFSGDTLFFASNRKNNGFGGYDLYGYSYSGDSIWNLGLPINSAYDDFSLWQVTSGEAYMVSNRASGKGLSDIYKIIWNPKDQYFKYIEGEIVNNRNLTGEEVVLLNSEGSIIQRSVIDNRGKFILKHVKGIETYRINLTNSIFNKGAELKLYDSEENLIKHVKTAGENGFFFELLTPKDYYMEPLNLVDESILAVDVIGKLFMKDDSSPKGFKIILTDSDGDVLATSQANAGGVFSFEHVRPDTEYRIRSEVKNVMSAIYILDSHGNLIQTIEPREDGDFIFVRLSENDQVITITNEMQQVVKFSNNELFTLASIQYEYNSAILSAAGIGVLDKLVEILSINPEVSVELSGHTDAKGTYEYNQKLSERRISNAIEYLLSMGVDKSRISGKGYGESRLLNHCVDDADCAEVEHAVNRRTELRIFYPER
jgi:outer membrane protein OmpA-like peptidoglycan-associated protein